ncbi:PTS glucose transporter subunit IIA, partial [uncultured Dubosiella sp.]
MKNSKIVICSPVSGRTEMLENVPDPIFSQKMMGDGVAVIPENGDIVSPVDGELTMIAATKHAYGFKTADGVEILVHVGLETVGLDGEGFTVKAEAGQKVKKGDVIAHVDLDLLKEK